MDAEIKWTGSPFRGLASYGVDDAPIFFGRTRAQLRLRALLEDRAAAKRPWVLVTGTSGSGKSSLVLAGLLADVRKPGLVAGVGEARFVVVRPSDAGGDPLRALARGLFGEKGLPELASPPLLYNPEQIGRLLAAGSVRAVAQGLAAVQTQLSEHYRPLLVVVVDQLEELLRLSAPRCDELVVALESLSAAGVWIVATIRADFVEELDRHTLGRRFDDEGRFLLGLPTYRELGQIITRPAALAGLSWDTDETGMGLDEELQRAALRDPAALPLLGYVLEQLWHRRRSNGALAFEAYRALGALEGAIGRRAEEVFQTLPEAAQLALPEVLARLAIVGQGDNARPVAESAAIDRFDDESPARVLVDALLAPDARLLVASEGTIHIAHEAVLTHWPRAAAQLETDRRDIQLIVRLREHAHRWLAIEDEQQRLSLLLAPGLPLTEAEDLLAHRRDALDDEIVELIEQSALLRREHRTVSVDQLRELTKHFASPHDRFQLDPSFESERTREQLEDASIPPPDLAHTVVFRLLQECVMANLVRPVDAPHMWHAAMLRKSCELTPLGKYYWRLVADGKL